MRLLVIFLLQWIHNIIILSVQGGLIIKKLSCVIIVLLLCFSNGCASNEPDLAPADYDSISVSVTIPTDLIGLHEKFDFEVLKEEIGIQGEVNNPDGSITLNLSKNQQIEILVTIKELVNESINDILQDEMMNVYYSDIEVINECTGIQVYMFPDSEFGMLQEMVLLPVKISCMIYQAFNGRNVYGTQVSIFNSETKEIITEYYYSSDEL